MVTFNVPGFVLKMPPPWPLRSPSLIVISEMLTVPAVITVKTRYAAAAKRATISLSAPGPIIDTGSVMLGRGLRSLMVQAPAVQKGSDAGIPKVMRLKELFVFAASIAPRSEQPDVLAPATHAPATTVSEVFFTVIGRVWAFCEVGKKKTLNTTQANTALIIEILFLTSFLLFKDGKLYERKFD